MKRWALAALLFSWLLLLTANFAVGSEITDTGNGLEDLRFTVLGVPLLSVPSPAEWTGGLTVHPTGAFVLLSWVVLSFGLAFVLARATERLRARRSPLRWTLTATILVILASAPCAAAWSRAYWGYWFRRPESSVAWWRLARVTSLSTMRCERVSGTMRCVPAPGESIQEEIADCESDPYYCLDERLPVALQKAGLLSHPVATLTPRQVATIERVFSRTGMLVKADPGYKGDQYVVGYAASGVAPDGRPILAIAMEGGQVENDHYPMYELVVDGGGKVLDSRVFFWDVAGLEGFEFWLMLPVLLTAGLLTCIPLALLASAAASYFPRAFRILSRRSRISFSKPTSFGS